jgi:hypothetical protein
MINIFTFLYEFLSSKHFLFGVMLLSILFKTGILIACVKYAFKAPKQRILLSFLIIYLAGSSLADSGNLCLTFILKILGMGDYMPNLVLLLRLSWTFYITQYQALALFFEYLINKRLKFGYFQIIFYCIHGIINVSISSAFLYLAIFKYHVPPSSSETLPFEEGLVHLIYLYLPLLFAFIGIRIYWNRWIGMPRILGHQLRFLVTFFFPYLLSEIIGNSIRPLGAMFPFIIAFEYSFFTLSTLLSTAGIYFVSRRMMGLRFLNMRQDIESREKFNFLSQFRDILEQLSYATALKELAHLTQTFFQTAFSIPLGRTRLYIRKGEPENDDHGSYDMANISSKVEQFLSKHENNSIFQSMSSSKIFIRDEIHFTHFYEEDDASKEILLFLDTVNADIFLPIYERSTMTAYIIVERNAVPHKLFTNKDRDEMLVFTTYLSNIINILKYSNIEALHQRHKQLTEELYHKHQEINQYKESIRSFLRSNKERKIGIVFYKHRRFTVANESAQELIGMDMNTNEGHALTQAFRSVARRVQEYKTSQTTFARDHSGTKVIIAGVPSLEEYATILLIYYPEISDIIKTQFDQLKDPSTWDYILYLETTHSGQVINQLIPGSGEKLLNFKIELLSLALSKKATLLDMPEDDLLATVDILHDISLRQTLHTLKLTTPEKNDEVAIKLFGLNPLIKSDTSPALLEKLDGSGTLFIQNVEYLSLETQEYLAQFISLGFFHKFRSDHKVFSNVRIICSSAKNLLALVNEGTFSKNLYNELQKASLSMPALHELSQREIDMLAQGYAEQIVTTETYKNLLALTDKDKTKLYTERPLSLREFREKVHQLLVQKSTKHKIQESTEFNPAYNVTDPDIAQAVKLGKKALKDPHAMAILWNKFKNQNKIATLLGVNRSSVNRRCQEYNLI